ncbi:L,D-transpeptidase family protein [Eubacteriales bacterium OttesenSCG-928-N14]|nr:L,D-transpeptidase family protein [Eubacteriales bacterium OttesenSCG-928-N14]
MRRRLFLMFIGTLLLLSGCSKTAVMPNSHSLDALHTPPPEPSGPPYPQQLAYHDSGENVSFVQHRLTELGYYLGNEITGNYGERTKVAISEFQLQNSITPTGLADAQTCDTLFADTAIPCTPFSDLAPTVTMSFEELMGDDAIYGLPKGYPAPDTYQIIVDIQHQVTMVYAKDANGEYTVPVRYMLCSTGLRNWTPVGTFAMQKYRVRFEQFERDRRYGQYWSQIRGAIYFHTILYTRKNMDTYENQAYQELGQKASHGCIRLTVPDARWIWYNISYDTTCIIRNGDPNDIATAMIREQLILAELPQEKVTIKAGEVPYTDNWTIDTVPHDVPFRQGSQN